MDRDKAADLISAHEGRRYKAYADSLGIMTVGIGCNLERDSARERIAALGVDYAELCAGRSELNDSHVDALFTMDLNDAIAIATAAVANFWEHPDDVQHAIVDMIFNLGGPRFTKFKKAIDAFERKDYRKAAAEMASSKWAAQVPNRARADIELVLKHAVG